MLINKYCVTLPFIAIPELKINTENILNTVLSVNSDEWVLLPWGQYEFDKWNNNLDIFKLLSMFNKTINYFRIICMRFDPNTGLPIHKDNKRLAVIQIPLSSNCMLTPTLFYNKDKELITQLPWSSNSAWMFDTHEWHSIMNDTSEPRYTLCISFLKYNYATLLSLYKSGLLLK
jgi:hypothetical protein